jgi:hypothetical protein
LISGIYPGSISARWTYPGQEEVTGKPVDDLQDHLIIIKKEKLFEK